MVGQKCIGTLLVLDLCIPYGDSKETDPKPPAKLQSNEINPREIVIHEEHNMHNALVNIDARNDHFGEPSEGGFPHLTVWPIVGAVVATLLLVFIVKKIRDCIHKCKAKKEAKISTWNDGTGKSRRARDFPFFCIPVVVAEDPSSGDRRKCFIGLNNHCAKTRARVRGGREERGRGACLNETFRA